ncbi:maltose acetyltransferase domain-containing protein [Streptomyces sp. CAU 1734]|uniref:maltose acetyltransferase domain-containing protein n=1 Tax=Streptomyces sp. CAU 1734 TaxID=3140360 RepID=UPI0032617FB1
MAENKVRMLDGHWYIPNDPELAEDTQRRFALCAAHNADGGDHFEARAGILAELFGSIGENVNIRPPFPCDYGAYITIGDRILCQLHRGFPGHCTDQYWLGRADRSERAAPHTLARAERRARKGRVGAPHHR